MPVASNWRYSVSIHLRRSPRVTSPSANREGYDNMGNGSAWQVKNEDSGSVADKDRRGRLHSSL